MNCARLNRFALATAIAGCIGGTTATAQVVTLTDGNAVVQLERDGAFAGSASSWTVGSRVDHLTLESYHFRTAGDNFERFVGEIGAATITQFTANFVEFAWAAPTFDLSIRYLLTGGTNRSDLAEIVSVRNRSNGRLDFTLFEYDDFDLAGTSDGDTATKFNSSTIGQSDGGVNVVVGATPIPDLTQVAGFPDILTELTDLNVDNLDPTLGSFGPGDATFAMQWNTALDIDQTFLMSKNKILTVPEPATLAALALGIGALAARRRKTS